VSENLSFTGFAYRTAQAGHMRTELTPDDLLQEHPRETLRWLRGFLQMTQEEFATALHIP
jgi:hypothetical protein